jgi:hypothetical protein
MKILCFFLFLWVIFDLLDPDPQLMRIRIRIRIRNPVHINLIISYWVSVPHWSQCRLPDPAVYLNAGPASFRGSAILPEV